MKIITTMIIIITTSGGEKLTIYWKQLRLHGYNSIDWFAMLNSIRDIPGFLTVEWYENNRASDNDYLSLSGIFT